MTKVQFDEWVAKMVEKYKSEKFWSACDTRIIKNVVVCVDRNNKVGIAKCHPDDEFNSFIGTAIAYARMRGLEVPKVTIYKKLSEMKNGEMFKDIFGCTCKYIGKNKGAYVVYVLNYQDYYIIPCDAKCEMVD